MKRKKSGQRTLVAYLCHFRPAPEGGFTVTCPKLPPVVTYGETFEEARANAREAIELCLEVMREDGQPIPPPDRDLASPIDQLVPVAAAERGDRCRRCPAASSSQRWSGPALM